MNCTFQVGFYVLVFKQMKDLMCLIILGHSKEMDFSSDHKSDKDERTVSNGHPEGQPIESVSNGHHEGQPIESVVNGDHLEGDKTSESDCPPSKKLKLDQSTFPKK